MDISKALKAIEDNLQNGHYDIVVQQALLLIEKKLRAVVKHDLSRLQGSEELEVFAHITKKNKPLDSFTMGEVVGLLRETKFLEGWKQRNQKELHVFETVDLNKLIALRNATAHGKPLVYSKIDAELLIAYQRMIFQTFNHEIISSLELLVVKQGEFRDKLKDGTDAPAMVWLPRGKFMMGSNENDHEKPIHEVTIDYEFGVGKYPVTFEEYDKFCTATKREKAFDEGWRDGREEGEIPVINVTWSDAEAYCQWLSEQTGEKYQLLSESEWEYACQANSMGRYYFGNDTSQLHHYAWFIINSRGKGHIVGQKKPNTFGLYDMHGNVWEWCKDVWHENYQGAPINGSAWLLDGDSTYRSLRGGAWNDGENSLRSVCRDGHQCSYISSTIGFRISRM